MGRVRIGMAQMPVVFGKTEENLETMERFLRKAEGCADLAVFPECSDLGWGNVDAPVLCHEIPGKTSRAYWGIGNSIACHVDSDSLPMAGWNNFI